MLRTNTNIIKLWGWILILVMALSLAGLAFGSDTEAEQQKEEARQALIEEEYEKAARLYSKTREMAVKEELINSSLYWEAFSRYRLKKTNELEKAYELLSRVEEDYVTQETEALRARVLAELAERGEVNASRLIHEKARAKDIQLETKVTALQSLLRMDSERAQPMLEEIIRDDSPSNRELRSHAVMIVCHEENTKLNALLLEIIQTETDPEFLTEVIMCLASHPSSEVIGVLLDLYHQNKNPEVREGVMFSLSMHSADEGDERVISFLSSIAKDQSEDLENRENSLMALSQVGNDEKSLNIYLEILQNKNDTALYETALYALARLESPASEKALLSLITGNSLDEELKSQALFAASHHDGLPLSVLKGVFDAAQSEDLKLQVCHMLSRHQDKEGAVVLMLELARTEINPEVKQGMVYWLGNFDDPRVLDYLVEVLNEK